LGHSLGAIVGGVYLGVIPSSEVWTGTLAMPGGGIAQLLLDSPDFGPRIVAGLQAQGIQQGTTLFEQFFRDAQTAVDSGDPINFIAAAAANHPLHIIQVVGGGSVPPDQVVPNSATVRLCPGGTAAERLRALLSRCLRELRRRGSRLDHRSHREPGGDDGDA